MTLFARTLTNVPSSGMRWGGGRSSLGSASTHTDWLGWPYQSASALDVQGLGFWLNVAGLMLTIAGFVVTFVQLRKTMSAAEAAQAEAKRIEGSLKRYDAAQDVSQAQYALRTARKHFGNKAWDDGAESYEDVRRALLSLKLNVSGIDPETVKQIEKAALYIAKLCERVDRGELSASVPAEVAKAKSLIRQHEQLVTEIGAKVQNGVF